MNTHLLVVLSLLVACSGSETPVAEGVAVDAVALGTPDAPVFATGPGTFQVAWTRELSDANRPGPPVPAGASVEVVAVNGDVASVRTMEDPPRAGKLPVHGLIAGTGMQPGVTGEEATWANEGSGIVVPSLTLLVPYAAQTGHRAVVDERGTPHWIDATVMAHDPKALALGAEVATVRWSLDAGDTDGAILRLRGLEAVAGGDALVDTTRVLFAAQLGEKKAFRLLDDRVHDPETKLTWRRCADGQGWNAQRAHCEGIGALMDRARAASACGAFRSDDGAWRLPSTEELVSVRLCSTGVVASGACAAPQATAALALPFEVAADRVWTRDREEGALTVVDLSTGEPTVVGAEDPAMALCVTEAFDGNTYLQTTGEVASQRAPDPEEGETPQTLDADMLYLTAMPAHVPEDELDDLMVQLRSTRGIRWVRRAELKEPAFPLQAVAVEAMLLPEDALKTGECVELFGPSDRITAGENVRVVGPGEQVGTLVVEVERGCQGTNGLTFRNVSTVSVGGPALRVRSDAEDPCRDVASLVPPSLRENMNGRLPNHPVLCTEWRFAKDDPFFPGATEQYRAYLEQDVVVEASAFTGYIVDGQLVSATPVAVDATFSGGSWTLVASTAENALRRTADVVIHRASLYDWKPVTTRLKTGGGPRDEMFTFDPVTGNLVGSLGLVCTYDDASVSYRCE